LGENSPNLATLLKIQKPHLAAELHGTCATLICHWRLVDVTACEKEKLSVAVSADLDPTST
jgi:hypothetical protein